MTLVGWLGVEEEEAGVAGNVFESQGSVGLPDEFAELFDRSQSALDFASQLLALVEGGREGKQLLLCLLCKEV